MADHTIAARHAVRPPRAAVCPVLCLLLGLVLAGAFATPHAESSQSGPVEVSGNTVGTEASPPTLLVEVFVSGLSIPWDITFTPDATMLFTQRGGVLSARLADGTVQTVSAELGDLFARSETGLMAIVVDPGFASNRRFYHVPGPHRARGAGHRMDYRWGVHLGHPGRRSPRRWAARRQQWQARGLPAALRTSGLSMDLHRRRGARHKPAGPDLARRNTAHRGTTRSTC